MQNGNGYQGFNDMINGGGAGQSGQSFEGGGLLSMIANMIAKPRGSQQGQPQAQTGGLLSPQARPAMPMQAQPQPMRPQYPNTPPPGFQPPQFPSPQQPPQYSGRGAVGMPTPPPLSFEEFVMGLGPSATTVSPEVLQEAYRLHMSGYGQ
jgi:hypothetical protein